jgi:ribonuclease BN (tRNA processing enzyme)
VKIQILGAHNLESRDTKFVSLLIDDVLVIDTGGLTSSLSQKAQQKLKAVLLTHQHFDHMRDVPALGINFSLHETTLDIYATQATHNVLTTHLLNDITYPDYTSKPTEKPALRLRELVAGREETIAGYKVLPVTVNHTAPTMGYQITSADGKKVFYTGDTGPGLGDTWRQISPHLIIIEVTAPNKYDEFARKTGHLTPILLQKELESFREIKSYLPGIVLVHMNPLDEKDIKGEIDEVNKALHISIRFGHEGMIMRL